MGFEEKLTVRASCCRCDLGAFIAVGYGPALHRMAFEACGTELWKTTVPKIQKTYQSTKFSKSFLAGDMAEAQSLVVWAIF